MPITPDYVSRRILATMPWDAINPTPTQRALIGASVQNPGSFKELPHGIYTLSYLTKEVLPDGGYSPVKLTELSLKATTDNHQDFLKDLRDRTNHGYITMFYLKAPDTPQYSTPLPMVLYTLQRVDVFDDTYPLWTAKLTMQAVYVSEDPSGTYKDPMQ